MNGMAARGGKARLERKLRQINVRSRAEDEPPLEICDAALSQSGPCVAARRIADHLAVRQAPVMKGEAA